MTDKKSTISRRQLIKLGVTGLAALPLSSLLVSKTQAGDDKVKETDALAQERGYQHDATQTDSKGQLCKGCQFFQGSADAEWAPCVVFSGKQVNAKGWCKSWFKKAS